MVTRFSKIVSLLIISRLTIHQLLRKRNFSCNFHCASNVITVVTNDKLSFIGTSWICIIVFKVKEHQIYVLIKELLYGFLLAGITLESLGLSKQILYIICKQSTYTNEMRLGTHVALNNNFEVVVSSNFVRTNACLGDVRLICVV